MKSILIGPLVAVILAGSANAGEIVDKATQAESLVANGKYMEAVEAIEGATTSLWDKLPLSFRKALWIAGPARGFGSSTPRETNAYLAGDEMIAYAEPVGFRWRKVGDMWQNDFCRGRHPHDERRQALPHPEGRWQGRNVEPSQEPRIQHPPHDRADQYPYRRVHGGLHGPRRRIRQERHVLPALRDQVITHRLSAELREAFLRRINNGGQVATVPLRGLAAGT
jgi:hypothetical protein